MDENLEVCKTCGDFNSQTKWCSFWSMIINEPTTNTCNWHTQYAIKSIEVFKGN